MESIDPYSPPHIVDEGFVVVVVEIQLFVAFPLLGASYTLNVWKNYWKSLKNLQRLLMVFYRFDYSTASTILKPLELMMYGWLLGGVVIFFLPLEGCQMLP